MRGDGISPRERERERVCVCGVFGFLGFLGQLPLLFLLKKCWKVGVHDYVVTDQKEMGWGNPGVGVAQLLHFAPRSKRFLAKPFFHHPVVSVRNPVMD